MSLLWSKTGRVAMLNPDSSTKKGSSVSNAYFGFDSSTKNGNNVDAVAVFDTSTIPSVDDLRYKKNIKVYVGFGWEKGYESTSKNGTYTESADYSYNYTLNNSVKTATDLLTNTYNYYEDNTKMFISDAISGHTIVNSYDTAVDGYKNFVNKSISVLLEKNSNAGKWYGGLIKKDNTLMEVTGDYIVPTVSVDNDEGNQNVGKEYTVKLNYSCNYKTVSVPLLYWEIYWKSDSGKSGVITNIKERQYTFKANTFPVNDAVTFTIKTYNDDDAITTVTSTKLATFKYSIPNVTMTAPIDGAVEYKSNKIRFEWNYSDDSGSPQTSYKIRWNGGEVTNNSANKYHVFQAGTFAVGVVTYYLKVTNGYGQSKEIGPFTFNAELSTPTVACTEPIDEEKIYLSQKNTFKWNYSDPADLRQTKAIIYWNSAGTQFGQIEVNGNDNYKIIDEYTFPEGILEWMVDVTNEDNVTTRSDTYKATVKASEVTVSGAYPADGTTINYSKKVTMTWEVTEEVSTGIVAWSVVLEKGSVRRTYTGTNEKSCVITPSDFGEGTVSYTISVTNRDGKTGTLTSTFEVEKAKPIATPIYPVGVGIINTVDNTFLWNYTDEPIEVGQASYELTIKNANGGDPIVYTGDSEQYVTVDANTLENGVWSWAVQVTNNDGETSTSKEVSFVSVGPSKRSVIHSVTQDAKPVITWSGVDVVAYEIEMYDSNSELIYKEELSYLLPYITVDGKYKSTVGNFIKNDSYKIKIRTLNSYGYYTDWTDYAFNLEAENTEDVGEIFIETNKQFGASIDNLVANEQVEYNYVTDEWYMLGGYGLKDAAVMIFSESESECKNIQIVWAVYVPYTPGTNPEQGKLVPLDPTFDSTGLYDITNNENLVKNIKLNNKVPLQYEDDASYICNINYSNTSFLEEGIQILENETLFSKKTGKAYKAKKLAATTRVKVEYSYLSDGGLWMGYSDYVKPPYNYIWEEVTQNSDFFVCRQEDEEPLKTLGKYKQNDCDYAVALNKEYKYNMLVYNQGIKYTNTRKVIIKADGVIIRDLNDDNNFVHIWKTENQNMNIMKQKDRTKNLFNVLGRKYPIKENGEWINNTRSFDAYVTEEEFERLEKMIENSDAVRYQADQEYMVCDMELSNTGIYVDGGRFISVTLTQIEED